MKHKESKILIFSVFIAGLCSIIYELLIATASSYFLGDSIKQFSMTIGAYMAAMGVGSYLSRLVSDDQLLTKFIRFELLLGLIGGLSVPLLYAAFAYTSYYQASSIGLTLCIGILIGLEIPFLSRLLEKYYSLKINISNVLSIDYLGALVATLVFPFLLLPALGTFKTSLFFGLINMSIAVILLWAFADTLQWSKKKILWLHTAMVTLMLGGTLLMSNTLLNEWSNQLYTDRIIYAEETPYQNIVMTKHKEDVRLFLNGNLQFSSTDEYRYHEVLVHVPFNNIKQPQRVLILGGGDGLGVREVLKYSSIQQVTLVDLDPAIFKLAKNNAHLIKQNQSSLLDPRVRLINQDAFQFLLTDQGQYDAVIADLPDPNNPSLARLYSREFYRLIKQHLKPKGIFVTQATSPYFSRKAYWTIVETVKAAGYQQVSALHVNVPSFGEWGFVMASNTKGLSAQTQAGLDPQIKRRYLNNALLKGLWVFGKDTAKIPTQISTLDKPIVLNHYLEGWTHWN